MGATHHHARRIKPVENDIGRALEGTSSPSFRKEQLYEPQNTRRRRWNARTAMVVCYNWIFWLLLLVLASTHISFFVATTFTSEKQASVGHIPLLGPYKNLGDNDDPFTDRSIACVLRGRGYQAIQATKLLMQEQHYELENSTVSGYRLLSRRKLELHPSNLMFSSNVCQNVLAPRLDNIFMRCDALGYNVTTDHLRVLDGLTNETTCSLAQALPILIILTADNTRSSRFVVPSWDGSACVFRMEFASFFAHPPGYWMYSVNRTMRKQRTEQWLGVRNGEWRNGWLEDTDTGQRWYSDVVSSNPAKPFQIKRRVFDFMTGKEVSCVQSPSACAHRPMESCWGDIICITISFKWLTSVSVGNGYRSGLFFYQHIMTVTATSVRNTSVFVSNVSFFFLLGHWMLGIRASHRTERTTSHRLQFFGIGCLSTRRTFEILPIILLPRLRKALTAFFTAGIFFEGEHSALAESWFLIYPGITEVVLVYFSILDRLAKLTRRRMTDVFFGPTLLFFCALHHYRFQLTNTGWYGFDGRVPPAISAAQVQRLTLWDFFSSDLTLQLGGNITSLYTLKPVVIALNLLPLLVAKPTSRFPSSNTAKELGFAAASFGGLGPPPPSTQNSLLISYELARQGHVVVGDAFVISIRDWTLLALSSLPLRWLGEDLSARVLVLPVVKDQSTYRTDGGPSYRRTSDRVFTGISVWSIAAVDIQ